MEWTVRDVMTTEVVTLPINASLADAERLLLDTGAPEIFVVNEDGQLVGLLPDYEFLKLHLTETQQGNLESLMTRRFFVIGPESCLIVAARYLREHLHHRLAVVEDLRLIGMVTRSSVISKLAEQQAIVEAA